MMTGKHLTRRCSQLLAVPMNSFQMTSTFNSAAKLAAAGGGRACVSLGVARRTVI
jgi:hypothetical protein